MMAGKSLNSRPLFLFTLFLLSTVFEVQSDSFYRSNYCMCNLDAHLRAVRTALENKQTPPPTPYPYTTTTTTTTTPAPTTEATSKIAG